jgi:adenosylcobinamide-GDP ribazoletransferase
MNPLVQFIEAARFLTRVPLPPSPQKSINLSDALLMFPVVGGFIGAFSGALLWAGMAVDLPFFLSAIIAVGGTIILTGGLHEDGLGDVADGFGGATTRESKLAIMRDSRVGTYGVLGLVLIVAARLGIFATLAEQTSPLPVVYILIAGAALSRGAMVGLITHLPPARKDGLAATLSPSFAVSITSYVLALAISVAALVQIISVLSVAITIATAFIAALVVALLAVRQIGGHTGDVAGAVQVIAEIACLSAVVAVI